MIDGISDVKMCEYKIFTYSFYLQDFFNKKGQRLYAYALPALYNHRGTTLRFFMYQFVVKLAAMSA